jgi:CRISPR-associated endonuclease/helicase Cas3
VIALTQDDFAAFFEEVHGYQPFPWQTELTKRITSKGAWPSVLDLPTGSGKTAAIDVAIFHLALEADHGSERHAPIRIAFVVDRRLVVDDAFERAKKIADKLVAADASSVTARVADRLKMFSSSNCPLMARRLRGGMPRESDWARTPAQPTILCSTVDQIGSRLLFRGYGISDRMKPIHAGLVGSDCLILLDEAHLAEPFRQTLAWVSNYRSKKWRDPERGHQAPWGVALLTATPGETTDNRFSLNEEDYENETLVCRLNAPKPVRLVGPPKSKAKINDAESGKGDGGNSKRFEQIAKQVCDALVVLREQDIDNPAIGVVVNRVSRARAVLQRLKKELGEESAEIILMIGPARPVDREEVVKKLGPIRTRIWESGESRVLEKPVIVVATQCIEVGVDIDFDALITELAPLDALRQRFGRVNRSGRKTQAYSAVIAMRPDIDARTDDPVYGKALRPAWEYLNAMAEPPSGKGQPPIVDFCLNVIRAKIESNPVPYEALSPKDDAPVLMPAHVDLLSQTSPIPAADPEAALYLHGASRQPDSVTVVWRADVISPDYQNADRVRRLLMLIPPRSAEAIELPRWAVQRWLTKLGLVSDYLADIPVAVPQEEKRSRTGGVCKVFRWKGNDERSDWITPLDIRPGDTVVVAAGYGGLDEFGWNPDEAIIDDGRPVPPALDVADKAAKPFAGRHFAVRVAPGLFDEPFNVEVLAEALATVPRQSWRDLRNAVAGLPLPVQTKEYLADLDRAKGRGNPVRAYSDLYGYDSEGRPRGVVFVARFGIKNVVCEDDGEVATTEDDIAGSLPGFPLELERHSADVETKAEEFARLAGLPEERISDLKLAGYFHDSGKVDDRFQAWLHYSDPLGPDPDDVQQVLAKSGRAAPRGARQAAGLPDYWRHEALSVRLVLCVPRFAEAKDPELVLWLIGTHHGYGRPFFPHADPEDTKVRTLPKALGLPAELSAGCGPQSLGFDWNGRDWARLFVCLKARYGAWELARMEAVLRLADHRASEEAAARHLVVEGEN